MGKKKGRGRGRGAGPAETQPVPGIGQGQDGGASPAETQAVPGRGRGHDGGAGPSGTQAAPGSGRGRGSGAGPAETHPAPGTSVQLQAPSEALRTPLQPPGTEAPPHDTGAQPQPTRLQAQAPPQGARPRQPQTARTQAQEPQTTKPVPLVEATASVEERLGELRIVMKKNVEAKNPFPKRPGYGTAGRSIFLKTNHYPLNIPDGYIYHYDVEIESLPARLTREELTQQLKQKATPQQVSGKRLSAAISREVICQLIQREPIFARVLPAYDGNKNMFTRQPIQTGNRLTKIVTFREDGRDLDSHFKVSVQPVLKDKQSGDRTNAINLNCLHQLFNGKCTFNVDCYQAITALDIIMRNGPSLKLHPVRQSFFIGPRSQEEVHPLSEGKEIWFGHYQSIRPDQRRPVLIVDKAATTFYGKGPLMDYAMEFLNKNTLVKLNDFETKQLTNDLKNVQIRVTHLRYPRKYRIVRITRNSAAEQKFKGKLEDGTMFEKTVAVYFKETYKPLSHPNLPCVQVHPEIKNIYLPIEVCELVDGQHYKRKLTDEQVSDMIKFTCTTPENRFKDIKRSFDQTKEYSKRFTKEFGLSIENEPILLEGRVLEAPEVVYGENKKIQPQNGAWDLRNTKFLKGAAIKLWAMLCMANERFCTIQHLKNFEKMLMDMGQKMAMQITQPVAVEHLGNRGLPAVLEAMAKTRRLELVVIVLKDRASYAGIKQVAEVKLGIRTSCIQANNVVRKCSPQLVCNVLLKMNAKFDGHNSKLNNEVIVPILKRPVIVIGVDVSHSAPGDKVKPSLAAAVGSLDNVFHNYAACIKVQRSRDEDKQHVEVIQEFKDMVKKLLMEFRKHTQLKPEKIIIYRDGVSEGEFSTVCDYEIPQVDAACLELQKDGSFMPPVTFIVVQKRHHTRFVPNYRRDGVGRAGNVPPGTTVDKEVIHPVYHDYFLCSHFGIQGTSRPAHYTVLRDDSKLGADEIQKLSYHLCHMYARCTRSISIPAPVMYAHLAALRARQHLASTTSEQDSTSSDSSEHQITLEALRRSQENVQVAPNINTKMYYI